MNQEKLLLFANCIPVRGISRACIYDLQTGNVQLIPNEMFDLLITQKPFKKLKNHIAQFIMK